MSRWLPHLVTAIGYLLPGVAGLQLGVLQGYASPMFPAAGWALAALLFYGPRVLPAVWVGAFFTNLVVEIGNGAVWTSSSGALAALIATGACLQGWLASTLVQRRLGDAWRRLENDTDILIFTLLGGPVACLVSATVGVTSLFSFGIVPAGDYPYSWWNWWVGDTLGVLIAAPLSLLILERRVDVWRRRVFALAVPILITLTLIVMSFVWAAYWEKEKLRDDLQGQGEDIAFRLQRNFDSIGDALSTVRGLFEVTPAVSDAAFEHFSRHILNDHPEIAAFSFDDHVSHDRRSQYENSVRQRLGDASFTIRERDAAGQIVVSRVHGEYVPISYVAPYESNRAALGFNAISDPSRRDAIWRALEHQRPTATSAVQLVQDNESRIGVLMMYPTYRHIPGQDVKRDKGELRGFAVAAMRVDDLINVELIASTHPGVRYLVRDVDDLNWSPNGRVLHGALPSGVPVWRTKLRLADRTWELSTAFSQEYIREHRSLLSTVVGVAGMLFVGVLQLLLLSMTGRAAVVERKVREQTGNLKALDDKLRARMLEMQSILDNSSVGITFVRDRMQVWSNRRMAEMFGYSDDEMETISTRQFYPSQEDYEHFGRAAYAVLSRGERYSCERLMRHRDGRDMWLRMNGKLIDVHKPELGSIWVFEDISEQKAGEAELIRAKEAAEAASVAKSQFLATMSHELRTPMNGILGMAQLAMMPGMADAEREDCLRTLLDSGQALLTLLNDILDLSRVESGKIVVESRPFDPATMLADTERLFRDAAAANGVQLRATWRGEVGAFYMGDPLRLRQMLTNLVGNAVKFTHAGQIDVEAQPVTSESGAHWLEFAVNDTGIGISAAAQEELFQPFSQADSSTTRQYGGTGLGLSIVRGLAEAMSGEVGVESAQGRGSRFWFRVPADRAEGHGDVAMTSKPTLAAAPAVVPDGTPARVVRILVVEDNATNRKVVVSMLERAGYTVSIAVNGLEAMDRALVGEMPDLVLMDVQMPVMDGLEATQRIREWERDEGRKPLPIVALTASAYEEDRQRCLAAGMSDYLSKPVDFALMQEKFEQWLPDGTLGNLGAMPAQAEAARVGPAVPDVVFDGAAMVKRMGGDDDLARSVLALVEPDIQERLEVLREATNAADWPTAKKAAHSIKGMAGDIGAQQLAGKAKAMDAKLRESDPVSLAEVDDLEASFALLKARIADWLKVQGTHRQ